MEQRFTSTPDRRLFLAALVAAATAGCAPVYAPPVRGTLDGAPGRVRQGDVEVGATMVGVYSPVGGSAHVAVGVRNWLAVEGGGTFAAAPAGPGQGSLVMATGWAGTRFSLPRRPPWKVSLLLDGELGVGGGVGGERCLTSTTCDADGRLPWQRGAFGGYLGGGVGFAYQWFSMYGRARAEESVGQGVPATLWPSATVGFGFDFTRNVSLDVATGYIGFVNTNQVQSGWLYQSGLTVRFPRAW